MTGFSDKISAAVGWRWARLKTRLEPAARRTASIRHRVWTWIAVRMCKAGWNGLYWHLKPNKDTWELRMGYRRLKEYYDTGCLNHRALMSEPSAERRVGLYKKMYDDAFGYLEKHFGLETFGLGFDEKILAVNLDLFRGRDVLDYGCGFGQSTEYIGKVARRATGLDASSVCIEAARKNHAGMPNVDYVLHQSPDLPFADGSLDAVYSNDLFEHLHPDDGLRHLVEIRRVLRKGGQYLLYTPPAEVGPSDGTKWFFPTGCGFPPVCGHLKEYTGKELEEAARRAGYTRVDRPNPHLQTLVILTK